MKIIKRSGTEVKFDIKKITEATSGQVKINADDDIYFAVIDQKIVMF